MNDWASELLIVSLYYISIENIHSRFLCVPHFKGNIYLSTQDHPPSHFPTAPSSISKSNSEFYILIYGQISIWNSDIRYQPPIFHQLPCFLNKIRIVILFRINNLIRNNFQIITNNWMSYSPCEYWEIKHNETKLNETKNNNYNNATNNHWITNRNRNLNPLLYIGMKYETK